MTEILRIPAEACYWVRLPPSPRRWRRERVLAAIAGEIPADPASFETAWRRLPDGGVLALAVESVRLDALLAGSPEPERIEPDRIPEHVAADGLAPAAFDLLGERRTPTGRRRLEVALTLGLGLGIALLLALGGWRRHALVEQELTTLRADGARLVAACLPPGAEAPDDPLAALERAIGRHPPSSIVPPPAALLSAIAAGWPAELPVRILSCTIADGVCTIDGETAEMDLAERLLAIALAAAPGWQAQAATRNDGTTDGFHIVLRAGDP